MLTTLMLMAGWRLAAWCSNSASKSETQHLVKQKEVVY